MQYKITENGVETEGTLITENELSSASEGALIIVTVKSQGN